MGPPKRKIRRKTYSVIQNEINTFEQRWDNSTETYYLFNPITGETIFQQEGGVIDRINSYWAPPEKPSPTALTVTLLPVYYSSRQWGRRKFVGFSDENAAVNHIITVYRGFLARKFLQHYYRNRYTKFFDKYSGYYYFQDNYDIYSEKETSWLKPRLAFATDILPYEGTEDPEDFMKGKKLSYQSFTHGPLFRLQSVGKKNLMKAKIYNFISDNEWRDSSVRAPDEIDLEASPLGSIIAWLDGLKAIEYYMSDYAVMRTVACHQRWEMVLEYLDKHSDRTDFLIYGLYTFTKIPVPEDHNKRLTPAGVEAFKRCMNILNSRATLSVKIFALRLLYHLFCTRPGQAEFLNTDPPPAGSIESQSAAFAEAYTQRIIATNFRLLTRLLTYVPMMEVPVALHLPSHAYPNQDGAGGADHDPAPSRKSSVSRTSVHTSVETMPSPKGVEAVEMTLKCVSMLAHVQEHREVTAELCAGPALEAMRVCKEEDTVIAAGIQALYNFCYRCESGQEDVITNGGRDMLTYVQTHYAGDFDIMRQCRRLELALEPDGWRGCVEERIEEEMKATLAEYESNHLRIKSSRGGRNGDIEEKKGRESGRGGSREGRGEEDGEESDEGLLEEEEGRYKEDNKSDDAGESKYADGDQPTASTKTAASNATDVYYLYFH